MVNVAAMSAIRPDLPALPVPARPAPPVGRAEFFRALQAAQGLAAPAPQAAPQAAPSAAPSPDTPARPGSLLDIRV